MEDLVKYVDAAGIKVPKKDAEALARLNKLVTVPTRGIEGAGESSYRPELLRLFQRMTRDESAPEGTKPGDVYASGRILHDGKKGDGLLLIPVMAWTGHQRWPQGDPRPNCQSHDGKFSVTGVACVDCNDEPWKNGQKTDCQRVLHFYFLPVDLSGVYYIVFKSSSYKAGQNIVRTMEKRVNAWDAIWRISTAEKTNDMATFNVWKTSITADEPAPHLKALAEMLNDGFGSQRQEMLSVQRKRREAIQDQISDTPPPIDVGEEEGDGDLDDM